LTSFPEIISKPEYEEIRNWAREFANKEIAPIAEKIDRTDEYPFELTRKMGEYGLLGINLPQEYGGLGLDLMSSVIVGEEIARVSLSAALIMGVQNGLVGHAISAFGSKEQKEKYLPKLSKGTLLGCYGLTEPNAGSDATAITTKAERAGDSYTINGSKIWISQGLVADLAVVFTRTGKNDGAAGITTFIIEKGTKGFEVGGKLEVMGVRGTGTAELIFTDCIVPSTNMVGTDGNGFIIAMTVLNQARIGAAAGAVGIAEAAFDACISYSKKRVIFDRYLSKLEAIRFMVADMATRINAAKLLTYRAAYLRDRNAEFLKEASMAKLFATETTVWVCERAIQIHGGYGVSKLLPLERYLRDAKILDIVEGTSEVQRWILSREIFGDRGNMI
jgi:alkylation response protein AidB-like acyl-CoA dehydrogenase